MSSESLPSKSEVMDWNSTSLADYFKRMGLVGCDRVVKKSNMSGAKFLNMADLRKFPTAHIPYITKICKDINQNNKQGRDLFTRSQHHQPPKQEDNLGGWDSDEFDQEESDMDSERPNVNDNDDNYICAAPCDLQEDNDDEYELPPIEQPTSHFRAAQPLGDGDYLDSGPRVSFNRTTRSTQNKTASHPRGLMNPPPRPDPSPNRPFVPFSQSKPGPAVPTVDRSKKPGSSFTSKTDLSKSARSDSYSLPTTAALPIPGVDDLPPPPVLSTMMMDQGMNPQWYVGRVKRGEAEVSLRRVNKDGAFLVRDSSRGCTDQPYTLMVLYQHKVYNIQIRFLGNKDGYFLGTGLKGIENFSSVTDMITHHVKTPLVLIDGKERDAGPQKQCCLMHPTTCPTYTAVSNRLR